MNRFKEIVQHAGQRQKLAILFADMKKDKVQGQDIVILYDDLKIGSNIWASLDDDHNRKMALPVGDYNLKNERTVVVEEEGIIAKVKVTPTAQEEFRKRILSHSKTSSND